MPLYDEASLASGIGRAERTGGSVAARRGGSTSIDPGGSRFRCGAAHVPGAPAVVIAFVQTEWSECGGRLISAARGI
ncbi:hypothetical protein A5N78_03110 [Prescottella equi]|nr:hypothetical protein A6I91_03425 [Prescottella equi]ORL93165.1 hypothetical protein A5N78_03110 [Prescottella equi]ORM20397.1 hypothetical protein A5N70_04600 [Prescottella equi]